MPSSPRSPSIRRNGRRPADVARASVQILIITSVRAIDSFAARRSNDLAVAGILDDEGRSRTAMAATTIFRPIEEVYGFLHDFCNLPRFMTHLDSVVTCGGGRSRWRTRILGRALEWETEMVEDRPGELLAWRSVPDAALDHRGVIRLSPAPGGRGTEVHIDIRYSARGKGLGVLIATMLGVAPGHRAQGELRRLKQLLEAGEIIHSDASIHRLPHAAVPPSDRFMQHHATGEAA